MSLDTMARLLTGRDEDTGTKLLELLQNPWSNSLQAASMASALGISVGFTVFTAIVFSLLRPYNQAVYAPKLKHADEKHAPPPLGKAPWSWLATVWAAKEEELIHSIGMDATVFLRFVRMCRNMFLTLSVTGIGIILPIHLSNYSLAEDVGSAKQWVSKITPLNVKESAIWAQVVIAWVFNIIVAGYLWWNYRKILQLRRKYFETEDYQTSLHSRTLMLFDIPKKGRSDEGIARIIDEVAPNASFARTAVARNVKDLPNLISQHDHAVRKLEAILSKYLKNPDKIPAARPMCRPSKKDRSYGTYPKGQKVDAIEYHTQRIRDLEVEIKEVRSSVDKRGSMPYGFASYSDIIEAHNIAYAARKKKPVGTTIVLAPRPNDIIWENMSLSSATRSRKRLFNGMWIVILTLVWIAPNAMIAVFLVNLNNLGFVWPAFKTSLSANPTFWGVVQGILSPALMSLIYLVLPMIFRRLSMKSGDQTKTGRERHVFAKLYAFFVFNNLIVFSIYSPAWAYVVAVIKKVQNGGDAWDAVVEANYANLLFTALCTNSVFWVTYLLQRQLGAAIDLAQLWPLVQAFFLKKFSSPTPRELIELTAPPPFQYAEYYNYFLYYATVTMCFAGIQPLTLVATALYFTIDSYLKKYLILYRFVTKTESGGMYWRVVFNRFVFAAMLADLVIMLTCWVRGDNQHVMFFSVVPLPFLMLGFKLYCSKVFDQKMRFFSTHDAVRHSETGPQKESRNRSDRLASRFGHPALYKPLITPMVHSKAQNLLPAIYKGRLTDGREANPSDMMSVSGYSDMYALDPMQGGRPGKTANNNMPGFEIVSDNQMDFGYYKDRAEFGEDHGGGEIYGRQGEIMRPDTPGSLGDGSDHGSRPGTPSGRASPFGRPPRNVGDTSYQAFRGTPPPGGFTQQPMVGSDVPSRSRTPLYSQDNGSTSGLGLINNAAAPPMGVPGSGRMTPVHHHPSPSPGPSAGALGGGPRGYSNLAQNESDSDPAQYDYFRSNTRQRRNPGEGW
ncbi:hypothetical protein B0J13DRAFT_105778 [Dactylonectria estremocensis]|uniref:DUF221-domain-containing protein n=1 Tax=Dactylonectria estremocensis TaxID=1079267 RepID=A0A9P9ISC6_9HYPO|nr:hypothetical protein B0J13DRAFT_105778 [Dactylonectria estremocensis]